MDNLGLKYFEHKIIQKKQTAEDTFLFELQGRIDFEPGQFVQVALDHFGEATFAPCSDPNKKDSFELCIRACGSTTNAMIKLLPGDYLKIRGPYGNGWNINKLNDKEIILIVGGLGYVPIRPLLLELERNRYKYRRIFLLAGFKSEHQILFAEEFDSYRKNKQMEVDLYLEYKTENNWHEKGLVTEGIQKATFDPKKSIVLMCGPEIMFQFCASSLIEKGISESQIFVSFERRMECGIGICQHCNIGKYLVCRDGPVFRYDKIKVEIGK